MSWSLPVTCHLALVTFCIACGQANHRFCARQNFLRFDAFGGVAFQPGQFAVIFFCQPVLKIFRAGWRRGGGETAAVEAEFQRALTDGVFHRSKRVASLNCSATCCATSRGTRMSVLTSTSACL